MNNLKRIMDLKGVTPQALARKSSVAVNNIRRIMNDPNVTPYHETAAAMAAALKCSCAQIYGQQSAAHGDKVLLTERVQKAARELAEAMQDYSGEPLFLNLGIFTNEKDPIYKRAGWLDCFISLDEEETADPLEPLPYVVKFNEELPADESGTAAGL